MKNKDVLIKQPTSIEKPSKMIRNIQMHMQDWG